MKTKFIKSKQDHLIIDKGFLLKFSFRLIMPDIDMNQLLRVKVSNKYVRKFHLLETTKKSYIVYSILKFDVMLLFFFCRKNKQ